MTKKILRTKSHKSKKPLAYAAKAPRRRSIGTARQPKTAAVPAQTEHEIRTKLAAAEGAGAPVLAPPKPTERTFTLAEFAHVFGDNYGDSNDPGNPLAVALCALDDVARTLYTTNAALAQGQDGAGLENILTNAWHRVRAACDILEGYRPARAAHLASKAGGAS